ncbi:hypothetical protein CEXT_705201 [Caerostris extrusa]|uniref:Uncharacterized protein n=1 Tax=Caerostris extrusa TaxID=172846 RepID=A0AAV4RJM2_CAEEX|nr:hypothetical protein CEXT_705201 [Caerostris extrusa]
MTLRGNYVQRTGGRRSSKAKADVANPIKTTRSRIIWFCVGNPFSVASLLPLEKEEKKRTTRMKENILKKMCSHYLLYGREKKEKKKKIDMQ